MNQDKEQQQLQVQDKAQQQLQTSPIPHFTWPTSKAGPHATQPPPGQKPMPSRTEQVVEIGYNQETGTPSTDSPARSMPDASLKEKTAFDQQETAQEALKKRKKR
ncbi:MAG: hypothetical protein ACR2H5_01005 [Ktedonobacteraceae bacterium]